MDNLATFIRWVSSVEDHRDLIEQAREITYSNLAEVALIRLETGRLAFVRGGPYRIDFDSDQDGEGKLRLLANCDGSLLRVVELVFHTHPLPTGPSDADLNVLQMLNQESSMLYELFSGGRGTIIRPKGARRS